MALSHISGVFAAALTPLKSDFSPDLEAIPEFLNFLAGRGCHGALLLGTTGEGPSFSPPQREAIYQAAARVREVHPDFTLLAGTGTPSLEETTSLTRCAFELGFEGVLVLPPYYYRNVTEEGLFRWYEGVIQQAVPAGGALFGYHIPAVSGVPLSLALLSRLKDAFPEQFYGIKDSSGNAEHARQLGERFGKNLAVLTGNDRLFTLALENSASGCITAAANLISPILRKIWDAYQAGSPDTAAQERATSIREKMDRFQPFPPLLKTLLAAHFNFPRWPVSPPLMALSEAAAQTATEEIELL